ncbi:hypothetical protein ACFE04_016015 [Oxalis oulophora]
MTSHHLTTITTAATATTHVFSSSSSSDFVEQLVVVVVVVVATATPEEEEDVVDGYINNRRFLSSVATGSCLVLTFRSIIRGRSLGSSTTYDSYTRISQLVSNSSSSYVRSQGFKAMDPLHVSGFNNQVRYISAGYSHSCAITDGGETLSWGGGGGASGKLGHGHHSGFLGLLRTTSEHTPRLIKQLDGVKVKNVAAGLLHSACVDGISGPSLLFIEVKGATTPGRVSEVPYCKEVGCGGYHTCVSFDIQTYKHHSQFVKPIGPSFSLSPSTGAIQLVSLSATGPSTELLSSTVDESHSIGLFISVTGPPTARGGAAVGERVRIGDVGFDVDNCKVLDIAHGVHDQFTKPPEEIGAGD